MRCCRVTPDPNIDFGALHDLLIVQDEIMAPAGKRISFKKVCICLLHQTRMKAYHKRFFEFHFRNWLLRLGFTGEQIERPGLDILYALKGDITFLTMIVKVVHREAS